MPITDITARYLNSLEDTNNNVKPVQSRTNSPTKFKQSNNNEDLDDLARALNITPSRKTTKPSVTTTLLRSKFESPSATVSSFKTSDSSIGSTSPKKNHFEIGSDETPSWANKNYKDVLKRSPTKITTPLKPLSEPLDKPSSKRPFLSSPSNNASKDSPGYEYLCRIEAIKLWLGQVLLEDVGKSAVELISYIRNGIFLAKLANVILPTQRQVFTNDSKLQFKHTENINRFFQLLDHLNMPDLFRFELTDLYDAKNVPKVWFCLHALSYILNKQDSSYPKIENLVGKIDFNDDDIRAANRALVSAPLPNFSGAHGGDLDETDGGTYMKKVTSPIKKIASPVKQLKFKPSTTPTIRDNEKVEQEEEKELEKHVDDDPFREPKSSATTPTKSPGTPEPVFKIRLPVILNTTPKLTDDYYTPELEQHMTNIIKFQSLARGAVFRYSMFVDRILLKSYEEEFTDLFSIIRGNVIRAKTVHKHRDDLRAYAFEITELQSIIRRKFVTKKKPDLTGIKMSQFQAVIRGQLQRSKLKKINESLEKSIPNVTSLQSLVRMKKIFCTSGRLVSHIDEILPSLIQLQSIARTQLYHRSALCKDIDEKPVVALQSIIRRNAVLEDLTIKLSQVRSNKRQFIELQSIARGGITRTRLCKNVLVTLIYEDGKLNELFAKVRGNKLRRLVNVNKQELLRIEESCVVPIQSLCRGLLSRVKKVSTMDEIYTHVDSIITLQSIIRGKFMRREIYEFEEYYRKNINQVIRAQAILKRIFDQNAYRSLISSKNPSLDVIRRFLPLLSNRDRDFQDEVALSSIRDSIIDKCKINEDLENQIQQLDMKLALLDKNKISIEEFIKPTTKSYRPVVENVKSLERLTKSSKKRIELYQSFFYFLQTNPVYLTKLYNSIPYNNKDTKVNKDMFQLIVQLFPVRDSSITAHSREEYFFIKLIILLMKSDISKSRYVGDITKIHLTHWIEFLMDFNNHTYQRQHLKSLCGKFVIRLVDSEDLDFESDPSRIYESIVAHEVKVHGFSNRPRDISPQAAIQLPEVSNRFVNNLVSLRENCSDLLDLLEINATKIPDHVRLIARQGYLMSQYQFPDKSDQQHLAVAGVIFLKHYIGTILRTPGKFGINVGQSSRNMDNLRQLYRVMLQLFSMKVFSDDFLKPLNEYISAVTTRVESIIRIVIDVDNEIELVYEFNDYDDIVTHQRPKLTMSTNSISQLEKIIQQNIDIITAGNDDQLYKICMQLNNLISTPEDVIAFAELSTVVLNLAANTVEEPVIDSKTRALFTQAKRCLLYIIRVQDGDDLLELLIAGIQPIHEQRFEEEKAALGMFESKDRSLYNISIGDISKLSYHDLKKMCLEIILKLESMGELTRRNSFQELLNQIAMDIKTKDTQRKLRKEQLEASEKTISKLTQKEQFLRNQLRDYNRHVDSVLNELQTKPKNKKIFNIIPVFSKQYFYLRELRKRNRLPKFGSYKYSAKKLMDQKVLVDYALNASSSASKLDFMFSCHQAGKFTIEVASGTVNIPGASNTITLDELLGMQYENKKKFDMFDGKVTFDLDNFMALIFRKFYDIKKE